MRVFIVGAGAVGSIMARMLSKDAAIDEVVCGDRDLRRAGRFLRPSKRIRLVRTDASDAAAVAKAAAGSRLIVNAGLPNFNERIMAAALRAGANYQDLCSHLLDLRHAEQLAFDGRFRKAGLTALINTGVAPGVTNLLARQLADGFDRVERISVRVLEDQDADVPVATWSPEVMLDELSAPPLIYKGGRFAFAAPFSGSERYPFPRPFGPRRAVAIYGDEVATLPLYIKTKDVDMKAGGSDIELGAALHAAGVLSKVPVRFRGRDVAPFDLFSRIAGRVPTPEEMAGLVRKGIVRNAQFVAAVDVRGRMGKHVSVLGMTAAFPDLREILRRERGANYISYPTALAASAFARCFRHIKKSGVFPPEALDAGPRASVLSELRRAGVSVRTRAR